MTLISSVLLIEAFFSFDKIGTLFGLSAFASDAEAQNAVAEVTVNTQKTSGTKKKSVFDIADSVFSRIERITSKLEKGVSTSFVGRDPFVSLNKLWNRYICGANVTTAYFSTSSDYERIFASEDPNHLIFDAQPMSREQLENIYDFQLALKERGVDFLFVEAPSDPSEFNAIYRGLFGNDDTKSGWAKDIIPDPLILTDLAEKEGLYSPDMFFRTDHHWLPTSGLWAAGKICEELNENHGFDIDTSIFDISNYDLSYYKKPFLGSQGYKATRVYVDPEPFPLLKPNYDTNIEASFLSEFKTFSGTMEETLFMPEALKESEQQFFYSYYGHGDQALIRIHNKKSTNGTRMLIIRDSMANCVYPFLSQAFEYTDVIDPRHFTTGILDFIEKTSPDIVICLFERSNNYKFDLTK